MIYVFDTCAFSDLFRSFYRGNFPSLWEKFDEMVEQNFITSTREVKREILDRGIDNLHDWCKQYDYLFSTPITREIEIVRKIYSIKHFQQNIENKKLLNGGKNADPFVIAKAKAQEGTVVTLEKLKPNSARIPNICAHFSVDCLNLEEFMIQEKWTF